MKVAVGKSVYDLSHLDINHEELSALAGKINNKINRLSLQLRDLDEKSLLLTTALILQKELDEGSSNNKPQEVSTEEGKFNEEDIYNAMTENMENISNYIDQIISKISYHRSDVK